MAEGAETNDELLTGAELHRQTGVSATTFKNWTRCDPALPTVTIRNGAVRYTRSNLLAFCAANSHLRAAAKVQLALGQRLEPARQIAATTEKNSEIETLKSIVRDLRNAAHQNLQAVLAAARLAEDTARSHREQLEQLATSMAAYDAALTQLTAPSIVND